MSEERSGPLSAQTRDDVRIDVVERLLHRIHVGSLDRVMKVSLKLTALASFAGPTDRRILLSQVEQLDAAVRHVRETFFRESEDTAAASPEEPDQGRVEVALLDRAGVIVWTNQAWDDFCRGNGGDPHRAGVGRSYVGICDVAGDEVSADVARAIRTAVGGDLPIPARYVVSCPAPGRPRAFDTLVSTRFGDDGRSVGALVTLCRVV